MLGISGSDGDGDRGAEEELPEVATVDVGAAMARASGPKPALQLPWTSTLL
jgi:hypothetical protein